MAGRTVSSRPDAGRGGGAAGRPTYDGAMSGYGLTRRDSVGYNARNPYAYMATQAAKKYTKEEDK